MKHRFWGLRGSAYGRKRREVFDEIKDPLKARFLEISQSGHFTWHDYGQLAMEFQLPCSVLNAYLSALGLLHSHLWECAQIRASDIGVKWD